MKGKPLRHSLYLRPENTPIMDASLSKPQEETLLQLLMKERGYYQTIFDITREENSRLEAQRPLPELQPLLRQKQTVISCIHSIDEELSPLKRLWRCKKDRSDPLSEKIQEELSSLNLLLGEILNIDRRSQKHAEKHLAELKQRYLEQKEES